MIRYVTSQEMERLEREAEERFGISTLILMENAGRSVAESIERTFAHAFRRILVVCGPGNNGGDGFVAARHLRNKGYDVSVVLFGDAAKLKPDAVANLNIIRNAKIFLVINPDMNRFRKRLAHSDLIVDALFGTGLRRDLNDPYPAVIKAVNRSHKKVVCIDIPSGIDADTGQSRRLAVKGNLTVTLGHPKMGLLRGEGRGHAGAVLVGDISLPRRHTRKARR